MIARAATLALLLAGTLAPWPAPAQLLGDRTEATCSNVIRGNQQNSVTNVFCGWAPEQILELMRLALSASPADRTRLLSVLGGIVPNNGQFSVEAVARFLAILGEQPIDSQKLGDRFAQIAEEHVRLQQEIRQFRVNDPEVQALRDAAEAALQGAPDHDRARAKLEEARRLVQAKRMAAARVLADQQREEAALVRGQARIEAARLRFAEAARLYEEAAGLLPAADRDRRGADLVTAGLRWTDQGRDFGDNPALERAITTYRAALEERTRARVPLDWAATQNNLGNALTTLGERESGTARLEEAVAAYRAALQELTRERVPLDWALTQTNLGNALQRLGERESGTARLEEAVAAYRAALEERTPARVPLQWALTQHGLAHALERLAERRQNPAQMAEALACMQGAIEVYQNGGVSHWLPVAEASVARMQTKLAAMEGRP